MSVRRTTIHVLAAFGTAGLQPVSITWYDGRVFPIDRVLDIQKAASTKAGGAGICYTCMIAGKPRKLWREGDIWFVEEQVDDYAE